MKTAVVLGTVCLLTWAGLITSENAHFDEEPSDSDVILGGNVTLNCISVTHTPNVKCQWNKNGLPVQNETLIRYQPATKIPGNCSIIITNFQPNEEGHWQCVLSIDGKSFKSREAILTLVPEDESAYINKEFVVIPQNRTVILGGDVILDCSFSTWSPHCFWTKDNEVVLMRGRYSNVGNKIDGDCSLKITNAKNFDNGAWRCGYPRTDLQSSLMSGTAYLSVVVAPADPVITVNGIAMKDGDKLYVKLSSLPGDVACWSENGNPAAKITWKLIGHLLNQDVEDVRFKRNRQYSTSYHYGTQTKTPTQKEYPSAIHDSLKIAYYPMSMTYIGVTQSWQQHNLTCIASHPAYEGFNHTTSVHLIIAS